jgi:hypothetical protein
MARKWWLALLALVLVTPALAQMQVQRMPRPMVVQPIPQELTVQPNSDVADKLMTVEEAKAVIARLRAEKRDINGKLTEALATIEQMTKRGGSLVRAYCETPELSRNTAGGSEGCGRYKCGEVDGLCKKSCTVSEDCSSGYACDSGQCLTQAEVNARLGGD